MPTWRKEERREKKRAVSLQPVETQEPRNYVRETDEPFIKTEKLTAM
jgi:hypothetical protein